MAKSNYVLHVRDLMWFLLYTTISFCIVGTFVYYFDHYIAPGSGLGSSEVLFTQ